VFCYGTARLGDVVWCQGGDLVADGEHDNSSDAAANDDEFDLSSVGNAALGHDQRRPGKARSSTFVDANRVDGNLDKLTLALANATSVLAPGAGTLGGISHREASQAVASVSSSVVQQNFMGSVSGICSGV
jgi:hypothetical protein